MATIIVNDLEKNRKLDKEALTTVKGGYLGGYSGWIGNQFQFTSNFNYNNLFQNMSFDDVLNYTDRFINRTATNPFYYYSPSTALSMYNSGLYSYW